MSNTLVPGPMTLLRRTSPYVPAAGATKAAVLNHSPIDGFAKDTVCPWTKFGRNVPFVPPLTSLMSFSNLGVNGSPDAIVQSPLHCQSPSIARHGEFPVSQRLSC